MRFLLCKACWYPVSFETQIPASCSHCGHEKLISVPNLCNEPKEKYELTLNDRRLLKHFGIDSETPEPLTEV